MERYHGAPRSYLPACLPACPLLLQTKAATAAEEEAFGEIPEEFEDPLLGGIMKDPVKLPSGESGMSNERWQRSRDV